MGMPPDKFKALWLSHSSINDFLKCPRLYYLRSVYKDPKTGHKITLMKPPLALGQVVHDVIDSLSHLPVGERFIIPLSKRYDVFWQKISGKKGGFKTEKEEKEYKERGRLMLKKIEDNPGPVGSKAIKIRSEGGLPFYWFDEEQNIILCGKIDWVEYLPASNAVHIIDFKTGKTEEEGDSLQLPIYHLLATNLQKRKVSKASYWYLNRDDLPKKMILPDLSKAKEKVAKMAQRISLARKIGHFKCPLGGCIHCSQLERIFKGEGEKVGVSEYNQDIYIL